MLKHSRFLRCIWSVLLAVVCQGAVAKPSTYVDDQGVMRWTESKKEVCVFGTNYSVPFAYWDAREPIGADNYQSIDEDVYHIARLGLDGYRIHVWPSYISDDAGNLIYNEHFKLFDYLLFRLKERGIKMYITPMYLSGGEGSFVAKFGGKIGCLTRPEAYPAQANYLAQFVSHVNPYTGIAYKDDPDVIAFEINNEPPHWKRPDLVTGYINTMVDAIRATGCEQPLFYNMTTCAAQIDEVLSSKVDGGSFQWYPTGLTSNHDQKGNLLPNVDRYAIPFADKLEGKYPKFVYEFSPSDVGESSHLYPAMASSFREAGFQFAAQFAYDPMHAAYCNVEYRTHFMNLAYTPKKAIGLMIASEAFHAVPRNKSYGRFPKNNTFDAFRLSHENDLAEMVTDQKLLYSNHTQTRPPKPELLEQVAGTGNSPVVKYAGSGAYFLDKLEDGIWRLEVMPDAAWVRDPFFVPDVRREAAIIQWNEQPMEINLPDLGSTFSFTGLNDGNGFRGATTDHRFKIGPGAYLLNREGQATLWDSSSVWKNIQLGEFHAPARKQTRYYLIHQPPVEVTAGEPLKIKVRIASAAGAEQVELIVLDVGKGTAVPMLKVGTFEYEVEVPARFLKEPGLLRYNISMKVGDDFLTYPAGEKGSHLLKRRIYADDRMLDDGGAYGVRVVSSAAPICLFDASNDWKLLTKMHRKHRIDCIPSAVPGKSLMQLKAKKLHEGEHDYSVRSFCAKRIAERVNDLKGKGELLIYGEALNDKPCSVQLSLIMKDGTAYGGLVTLLPEVGNYSLPLSELKRVKSALIPRPYPSFLEYWSDPAVDAGFDLAEVESLQLSIGPGMQESEWDDAHGASIGWIILK